MQRTNYHLNENYCRSIPEHYKQGSYGGMSAIGCFAMNNEKELEWEECSIPSCDRYCSPYPDCDITECTYDDDASGIFYRIGKKGMREKAMYKFFILNQRQAGNNQTGQKLLSVDGSHERATEL